MLCGASLRHLYYWHISQNKTLSISLGICFFFLSLSIYLWWSHSFFKLTIITNDLNPLSWLTNWTRLQLFSRKSHTFRHGNGGENDNNTQELKIRTKHLHSWEAQSVSPLSLSLLVFLSRYLVRSRMVHVCVCSVFFRIKITPEINLLSDEDRRRRRQRERERAKARSFMSCWPWWLA